MAAPGEISREGLIALLAQRDTRIAAQDGQITALSMQVADLLKANEQLAGKLARCEHLLSRNSGNSSSPPSKDDDPGRTPPRRSRHDVLVVPSASQASSRRAGREPGLGGAA